MRIGGITLGDHWSDYQLPLIRAMGARVIKFHLFYDPDVINNYGPTIASWQMTNVIEQGVDTIILRLAETQIAWEQVQKQLQSTLKDGILLLDFIKNNSNINFIIEVGNEPDLGLVNPWDHRYRLRTAVQMNRNLCPSNVSWCASLPTHHGTSDFPGLEYLKVILSKDNDGCLTEWYDSLGVHCYGNDVLEAHDAQGPTIVLEQAINTGHTIWITECGINSDTAWRDKAYWLNSFIRILPAQVRGVTMFVFSADPGWTENGFNYGFDVRKGQIDYSFSGAKYLQTLFTTLGTPPIIPVQQEIPLSKPSPEITTKEKGVKMKDYPSPNFGYPRGSHGRNGRKIEAIVIHRMQGTLGSTRNWFANPASGASSTYGIGTGGDVDRYVQETDSPWTNGDVQKPDLSIPWLRNAINKGINPNELTETIECEGYEGQPWSEAMYQSILERVGARLAVNNLPANRNTVIGHNEINSVTRSGCPGKNFPWNRLMYDLNKYTAPQDHVYTDIEQSMLLKDTYNSMRNLMSKEGLPDPLGLMLYEALVDLSGILPTLPKNARALVCEKGVLWTGKAGQPDTFHRQQFEDLDKQEKVQRL